MDAREADRLKLARQVVRWRTEPRFRELLAATSTGERPVVVALPDDTVQHMFELARAAGQVVNVVTLLEGGRLALISMFAEEDAAATSLAEQDCPVHPDTHVDMLLTYLRRRQAPVRCFVAGPDYQFGPGVRELADSAN